MGLHVSLAKFVKSPETPRIPVQHEHARLLVAAKKASGVVGARAIFTMSAVRQKPSTLTFPGVQDSSVTSKSGLGRQHSS